GFSLSVLLKVVLLFIVMVPLMNLLIEWNASLHLPDSMGSIETWMRNAETNAALQTDMMLAGTGVGVLIVNLLVIAVMAGVSEELFFRAGLQRLLTTGGVNIHVSVWACALIFSAFHLQFFGFFPRLLLGALFGYLLVASKSVWLPAAAHMLNNAMVVVTVWLHNRRALAEGIPSGSVADISTPDIINPDGSTWGYVISALLIFVMLLSIFYPRKEKQTSI
ncbi:MAG: CPBP family intramembrane metalloprotease, partial [Duncaniella sp.]|nr:CPBP family intramembrane metalloprotease [Duncaniella sp.]